MHVLPLRGPDHPAGAVLVVHADLLASARPLILQRRKKRDPGEINSSGIWRTTGWRGSFRGVRFIGLVVVFHGWEQVFCDEMQH